ncbi:MAG: hypothetical protein SF339_02690 [Blastocatellia bacterium]|nr:hypothetical protein [Blastocatellia bacterium]
MVPIRNSPATKANKGLKKAAAKTGEGNSQWLARTRLTSGILLLGGSSLEHFRIRVAQSQVRSDLLPGFWSLAGILLDGERFYSVPLAPPVDLSVVPANNGVQLCRLADYDDPRRFPNVAVLQFPGAQNPLLHQAENSDLARDTVELIRHQRSLVDLPALMLAWLSHVWGVTGNPLLEAKGLPSAVFVESVYGLAGIELTPGLAAAASCPEAIWQAGKWWHQFYQRADAGAPTGVYSIRQPAAAVIEL